MNRAIGVFDSGIGGLTAVKEIKKLMPNENIIYLGDTGRVPYGTKSAETIGRYTLEDINFLLNHDIKAIVVACGTASSVGLSQINEKFNVPIFDVIKPTVKKALEITSNGKIGIIGTSATIGSKAYETAIFDNAKNENMEVFSKACPLFVPIVESGKTSENDEVTNMIIEEYLTEFKSSGIDTLILGCTHYPLISKNISNFLGSNVKLVNPGVEVSLHLSEKISKNTKKHENDIFFVTDGVKNFEENAKNFLGYPLKATLIKEL